MSKIRVYELAKDLNVTNLELLNIIKKHTNVEVKSHMSSLDHSNVNDIVLAVRKYGVEKSSIREICPDVAVEWHPFKNEDDTPDTVSAGSNKKYWWKCPKGPDHEWEAQVTSRCYNGRGCPFCSGKRVSVTNSIVSLFPEVAAQWHPTKNGEITPDQVVAGSNKKYWWKCPKGPDHEWEANSYSRCFAQTGCPFCAGKRVSVTNSLNSLRPEIAAQWHPTKNEEVTPDEVTVGSKKSFWWICTEGPDHEWKASISNRTTNDSGCPYCSGNKLSVTNSLATLFPKIASEWHPTKNGKITPDDVIAGSKKKYWWKCPKGPDHEWEAEVGSRTSGGTGCPFCSNQKISVTNSFLTLFPKEASQWHPTKNCKVTPDQVIAGSHKKYWWKCGKGPDHEWQATPLDRWGHDCPYCKNQKVSVTNSLATLYPSIAEEWHPTKNGRLTPNDLTAGSLRKVWWKCPEGPDHEWQTTLVSRCIRGTGCPYCNGSIVSVTNSLATLYPDLAAEWHPTKNGKVTPDKVVAKTGRKYWWKCSQNPDHEWQTSPHSRTKHDITGCPYCYIVPRSRSEIYLSCELSHFFDFDIHDHKVTINGKILDVDILIRDHRLIVELDGHYWHKDKTDPEI